MTAAEPLDRGRESFGRQAWADAYAQLSEADRRVRLEAEDLERLATAAYLVGREVESADGLGARASRVAAPGCRGAIRTVRAMAGLQFGDQGRDWPAAAAGPPGPAVAGRRPARLR